IGGRVPAEPGRFGTHFARGGRRGDRGAGVVPLVGPTAFRTKKGLQPMTSSRVAQVASSGNRVAARAAHNSTTELIGRIGFAARGVVYLIVGWLALLAAVGIGGEMTDNQG